ncbi:MAG TPA: hypothetical protein VNF72_20355 [Myxococcota bacterium]|nr:hypothetical protein [Myxococcota bacterium]
MQTLYFWPGEPLLSLFALWLVSLVFLWAARDPMARLLASLGSFLGDGCQGLAQWCRESAQELRKQSRAALLAAARVETQGKLERELQKVDSSFAAKLGDYSNLHRRLDEVLLELDADYKKCGEAPPQVPAWSAAVESLAKIPSAGDPNVQKVFESIRKSSRDAEKKALDLYREDTARRHKTLGAMAAAWKDVRGLMARMCDVVAKALESTQRIRGYADEFEKFRKDQEGAARALTWSATKFFVVSLIVLGVALGGAFVNFQLIALPMSELVPAGARVGGMPVATVSALVIVLMETALGIFIMDMLGITDLLPRLHAIPAGRRRLILGLALGFVLPWILAMVAIPLEMLLDSSRHVLSSLAVGGLEALGYLARVIGHVAKALFSMLQNAYDVYIGIPLRIEQAVRGRTGGTSLGRPRPTTERRGEVTAS